VYESFRGPDRRKAAVVRMGLTWEDGKVIIDAVSAVMRRIEAPLGSKAEGLETAYAIQQVEFALDLTLD
jgi:hypothetical protein